MNIRSSDCSERTVQGIFLSEESRTPGGSKKMMKRVFVGFGMALMMTLILSVAGFAQSHPVAGTYKVTATSSELGALNFQMMLKHDGQSWSGEVKDSPMPLTVTKVTVDADNNVVIDCDAGGTPVTIKGKFEGGKIAGDWTAGDMKGTWTAMRDAGGASTTVAAAGAAGMAGIEGEYDAVVVAEGQGELPFTLIIKRNGDKLVTEVPGGGDLNVVAIETQDPDVVNLTATYQGNGPIPLNGKRTGEDLGGKWEAGGFSGTWSAKKKKK